MQKEKKIYVTLYRWEQCGWCRRFQPDWDLLVNIFNSSEVKSRLTSANINISLKDYEYERDRQIIEKSGVSSYPTVKVTIKDNGKKDDFTLEDNQREVGKFVDAVLKNADKQLVEFIKKEVYDAQTERNNKQTGGYFQYAKTKRMRYYNEYLKLRKEYLALKNKK